MTEIQYLQKTWKELYSESLPSLARTRDPVQPHWPVMLDHCFARIILDNTVGEGRERWDIRLERPAVQHMSREQLKNAIELAERIKSGQEDLVALDLQSLEVRGMSDKKYRKEPPVFERRRQSGNEPLAPAAVVNQNSASKRKIPAPDDGFTPPSSKRAKSLGNNLH